MQNTNFLYPNIDSKSRIVNVITAMVRESVEDLFSAGGLTKWPHFFWAQLNIQHCGSECGPKPKWPRLSDSASVEAAGNSLSCWPRRRPGNGESCCHGRRPGNGESCWPREMTGDSESCQPRVTSSDGESCWSRERESRAQKSPGPGWEKAPWRVYTGLDQGRQA
jgi:hypothetical protein